MTNVSYANDMMSSDVEAFRRRIALLFALGCLVLGMTSASLGYAIGNVPDAGVRRPPVYPADWMFWAIWFVLYPTIGMGAYHLWRARRLRGSGLAWRLFLFSYAINLTWVPIVHWTQSPVAAPAVMDAIAGVAFLPATWTIARFNRPAFLWFLPILIWGVITGTLKIWQLLLNSSMFPDSTWSLLRWSIYAGAVSIGVQLMLVIYGFFNRTVR